jgi:hypothetical protein
MDSVSKIKALAVKYAAPPPEDGDPADLMIRTATQMFGPTVVQMLPEDPQVLDDAITEMAMRLLDLRSDGSTVIQLADADLKPLELAAGDA